MCNKHQQQNAKDLANGQGAHRQDVTIQTNQKKEREKNMKEEKKGKEKIKIK